MNRPVAATGSPHVELASGGRDDSDSRRRFRGCAPFAREADDPSRQKFGRYASRVAFLLAVIMLSYYYSLYACFATDGSSCEASAHVSEKEALRELRRFGELIHGHRIEPTCKIVAFGRNEYGRHDLCERSYAAPCVSITYGVQNEYTFELDMRERLGCTVFALDPTVNHKAELAEGVYFLKWAAVSKATASHVGDMSRWFQVSPTKLVRTIAPHGERVSVLKMDCEGCEHSLYDECMRDDKHFFKRVDQFAVEFHASKSLGMATTQDAIAWGKLLVLLRDSGHKLQTVSVVHCNQQDEATGTVNELLRSGYIRPGDGFCHNYLFARL